jgi:hypothetical protein
MTEAIDGWEGLRRVVYEGEMKQGCKGLTWPLYAELGWLEVTRCGGGGGGGRWQRDQLDNMGEEGDDANRWGPWANERRETRHRDE